MGQGHPDLFASIFCLETVAGRKVALRGSFSNCLSFAVTMRLVSHQGKIPNTEIQKIMGLLGLETVKFYEKL